MATADELHEAAERRLKRAEQHQAAAEQTMARLGYDARRLRTHALCQIGGLVSSALGVSPAEIDMDRLAAALQTVPDVDFACPTLAVYLRRAYERG